MKKLGFGCMRLPMSGGHVDQGRFRAMVDRFMEKGFSYFDTSYVYHNGESERSLRSALVERYPRGSFTITTKSPLFLVDSRERFFSIFDEQLERLGTDFVDYYWLHAVNGESYENVRRLGLDEALAELRDRGLARHIGLSYHDSPELLERILSECPGLEYVQLQLNYFDWDSPHVAARACCEVRARHGKPVAVMEPVKGGALASPPARALEILRACEPETSPVSWALRFAAGLEQVFVVLSGMSDMAQLEGNTAIMEEPRPLGAEGLAALERAARAMREDPAFDEQAMFRAQELCPKRIALGKIAQMLNEHRAVGGYANTCVYYPAYLRGEGKAADCDVCGLCLPAAGGADVPAMLAQAEAEITHF